MSDTQIAKFNTKREAEVFAGSLGPIEEWFSYIYRGHRSYIVRYYQMTITPEVT
jgi:hypothetical protein